MRDPDILLIEGCDFERYPAGGQLSMVRSLMKLFGNRLALVGVSCGDAPVGRWAPKRIDGTSYQFFATWEREPRAKKPLIPARLSFYTALRRYKAEILSLGSRAAFTQATEALLAVSNWGWDTLSFQFPGVENSLAQSRYWYGKPLRGVYDRLVFKALDRADLILAAADEAACQGLVSRSHGRLSRDRVTFLPSCVDTSEFHPVPVRNARAQLGIPSESTVFVNHGRIGRLKGWDLLLEAFQEFLREHPDALLFFVGDGEDRSALQARIQALGLGSRAKITGFQPPRQVASYLNAADVAVFASLVEGWPTATLEALACGKPVVCTKVSGATALVIPGQNGFIVDCRDPVKFREALEGALQLPDAGRVATSIAADFDLTHLGERLARLWRPFRLAAQGEQRLTA